MKYATSASGAGMSDIPDGKTYVGFAYNKTTPVESTVASDYIWSLIQGPKGDQGTQGSQGIPGVKGADGIQYYTWINYADSPTSGISDLPTGKKYMGIAVNKTTATESNTYADYTWSLIEGPQGGVGAKGSDGVTTYTWIKYATSAAGAGMSDSSVGKTYIGFAYNKTTAVESTTPGDYTWTLIQGPKGDQGIQGTQGSQGIPGVKGADGTQYYTWLKYADTPTTGMSDSPTGKTYMGIAINKTSATESSVYSDYTWSLVQGPKGSTGDKGDKGNTGTGVSSITPQYKSLSNLWGMPNPSENIAGYGGGNGIRTRTPLGLLVEVTGVPTASYSLVSTQSSYQVPVITNKKYTWRLPFKNVGSEPFPLTIYSWILGGTTRTFKQTLAPGESITVAFDDMTTPQTEGATIRYSIYYSTSETKPPIGAKILVADGATLVEGLTDDPWSNTEPPLQVGYSLFRREKIELDNGTVMYTPTSLVTANQSAERSLYISNLAKELAEGLVDLSPSMPENPLPGQVWISQDEKTNMTGVWRFNGSEWQQSSILTGLIMVPGEDGQMTLVGPKGIDAPSVLADIIRTEVLYADVGGVKKFIVSDIPRENLEDGVQTALDTAESIGTRIVLDGTKGELIIARDKYRSGVSDTMTVLTASSMNFMFAGKAVTSIDSATQQLTTVNAQVQGALRFPSHTIKTLPGTSILVFQQA